MSQGMCNASPISCAKIISIIVPIPSAQIIVTPVSPRPTFQVSGMPINIPSFSPNLTVIHIHYNISFYYILKYINYKMLSSVIMIK